MNQLLSHLLEWSEYLPADNLQKMVLDNLINTKLIPLLNQEKSNDIALDSAEKIITAIPMVWFTESKLATKLALLRIFVVTLSKRLDNEKKLPSISRVVKLLATLNDHDGARQLSKKYRLS